MLWKWRSDFYINGNLNSGYTTPRSFLKNSELTKGEKGEFQVEELEIYKVV